MKKTDNRSRDIFEDAQTLVKSDEPHYTYFYYTEILIDNVDVVVYG